MDTKQLVDKFIKGEITQEEFDAEKSKLTPEAQEQLKKDAEAALPDAVEKLKDVRRGIDKIADKNKDADNNVATKLREENFEKAKETIFAELGIEKDEDRKLFEEEFKKVDDGSVTVDNIVKGMKKYYASTQADDFFKLKQEKKDREREAEEFNAQNGGAHGGGPGGEGGKKPSKELQDFMAQAKKAGRNYTPEAAQRALDLYKNKGKIPTE